MLFRSARMTDTSIANPLTTEKTIDDSNLDAVIAEAEKTKHIKWTHSWEFYAIIGLVGLLTGIFLAIKCIPKLCKTRTVKLERPTGLAEDDFWSKDFRLHRMPTVPSEAEPAQQSSNN